MCFRFVVSYWPAVPSISAKNDVIYRMQDRLDKLEHDYENLMEQICLANQQRFGRHTEKLDEIAGQLSHFNEAEAYFDEQSPEPAIDEVVGSALKAARRPKNKGKKNLRIFHRKKSLMMFLLRD